MIEPLQRGDQIRIDTRRLAQRNLRFMKRRSRIEGRCSSIH
jgi:hypothetical protein